MAAFDSVPAAAPPSTAPSRSPAAESVDFAWRVLALLNGARLVVGALLLAVFVFVPAPRVIGEASPELAWITLSAMILSAAIETRLLSRRSLGLNVQAYLQVGIDLVTVPLLMHASGGISSGLGGLLVVSVSAISLLVPSRNALALAALAALAILGAQTATQLEGAADRTAWGSAGILGAVIFVITGVVQLLRRRMVETEALAEQRGVDLRNLAELNQYIIQHLRESIVVVDGDGYVRLINSSAARHLGGNAEPSQRLQDLSPPLAGELARWLEARETAQQSAFGAADGSTSIRPHFASLGGASGGVLIFLEDLSLLAERVQQDKLAALGRLSASIAHEIRNPIGAMSHAGQLLGESTRVTAEERRLTDIIRVNSRRVSNIVDSVLALSRREKTRPVLVGLGPWIEDFAKEFSATLELYEGAVAPAALAPEIEVRMDPTHLHQVVWNLCDNAVKYASATAGAVAVELGCGRLEGSGRPYLEVADRGPGVAADKVETIFEPFYTGQHGGTGLGLFISRELCEASGATLRYQPRPGGGSLFRIVFADPQRWQSADGSR